MWEFKETKPFKVLHKVMDFGDEIYLILVAHYIPIIVFNYFNYFGIRQG